MTTPADAPPKAQHHSRLHPVLVMIWVILFAAALTHVIDAGKFKRHGKLVTPGTYHVVPKVNGLPALAAPMPARPTDKPAQAASVVSLFTVIPEGMAKSANLIIMVLIVGGMFNVLRRTGAIDAGVEKLIAATAGNIYALTAVLMVVLALGSTFLGFISEYLIMIPIVGMIGRRLGLPNLFAMAVVGVAAKIGYAASVTNPFALTVAQPLAGVPTFSGMGPRLAVFAAFLVLGIAYVMVYLRRAPRQEPQESEALASSITWRQSAILWALLLGGVGLIVGTRLWDWGSPELSAFYVALALVFTLIGRLRAAEAADAFIDGMKSMVLAGVLIGLASSVELLLRNSQVLDTIIAKAVLLADGHAPPLVADGLMLVEMILDVVIPSVSGKAALSIPILSPIAQLSGVSGQLTVLAFVLGGGLMNMITPTSGMLLAYLATARVGYVEWLKFVAPLFGALTVIALVVLAVCGAMHL